MLATISSQANSNRKKGSQEWLQKRCLSTSAIMSFIPSMASAGLSSCRARRSPACDLELYVLRFEKERMTLRVPTNKAESVGMRKLSSDKTLGEALETLKGKPQGQAHHVVAPRAGI
jgi:hypothetical protein